MVELKLQQELSQKEQKKFRLTNKMVLGEFDGVQIAMCLGGVFKDNSGEWQYYPEYSKTYMNSEVTPQRLISFCELHKDIIKKERLYINRHFITVYYIIYVREEKPMIINDFNNYTRNKVDIELIFNDNGHYRLQDVHLMLSPNTSVIGGIQALFSNENIEGLPFITKEGDYYLIEYYDDYGNTKTYKYNDIMSIFNCITNMRLVGCQQVEME